MYPQQGGWPAAPVPPKKPSRAPLLLIPLVLAGVCVVGVILATRAREGSSERDAQPQTTTALMPAAPSAMPAAPPAERTFVSVAQCTETSEWVREVPAAIAAHATLLRCVMSNGVEGLRIPIGSDGVRAPTALARINHHVLVMASDSVRRRTLAAFRNGSPMPAPVTTALAQPDQVQRMNGVFTATIASSGPVNGMNVYRFVEEGGRTVLGLDSNPGSPLFLTGQRVRVYGVWGVKEGSAVLFPFWFDLL